MRHRVLAILSVSFVVACTHEHLTAPAQAPSPSTPLVVVDGREMPSAILRNLDPSTIERVEVVKGAAALRVYGDRARDGVVFITTKRTR